ncbi:uncharacterized protein LOC108103896 [Drosophila eugracilis]|uniref:uncharacterized protein LOC108103896 n=1 Tax=Drosophila eugracilis TaxID=29029 RepID=UPI0007E6BAA0|nr:uncharacterized protein LOC108103896 [Drosophila eugracilis]
MPALVISFFNRFCPSKRLRHLLVKRRKYLRKFIQIECLAHGGKPISQTKRNLLTKHVIGFLELNFKRDLPTKTIEITATLPNPQLPPKRDVEYEYENLFEVFVCNSHGNLLTKIPFMESDYRRATRKAIKAVRFMDS